MEMQDPSNHSHNKSNLSSQNQNAQKPLTTSYGIPAFPFRGSHHRRAHSEVNFRIPEDLDLGLDPFDAPSGSFEEMGSEDDLFSTFMDIEKFGSRFDDGLSAGKPFGDFRIDNAGGGSGSGGGGMQVEDGEGDKNMRPRHRHSNSVDGSSTMDTIEAKKAMAPEKLAELWTVDPKRVKRILANRQSAARSKERKARYMLELERKVQTLQTEATTLSAQLTLFQRDTLGLSTENTELTLRLQAMEQQAHLRDALNDALKKEVERLNMATGKTITPSNGYNLGMHHIPYNQPSFFSQPQVGPGVSHNIQMPQFHPFQPNMATHHQPMLAASQSHALSEMLQQDPLSRLQGLDINSRGSHLVKSEGPSISASESSNTF